MLGIMQESYILNISTNYANFKFLEETFGKYISKALEMIPLNWTPWSILGKILLLKTPKSYTAMCPTSEGDTSGTCLATCDT